MDPIKPANLNQPQPAPMDPEHVPAQAGKKVGPIISTLVIVLVLIIAALYVFASKVSQRTGADQMTDPTVNQATTTQTVQPVTNNSDDLQSIQTDLNTSTKGVDSQNF